MNLCILIDCCAILFYFFIFFLGPRVDYREILSFALNKESFIISHYHYLLLLLLFFFFIYLFVIFIKNVCGCQSTSFGTSSFGSYSDRSLYVDSVIFLCVNG